jgi:hypothetical protein
MVNLLCVSQNEFLCIDLNPSISDDHHKFILLLIFFSLFHTIRAQNSSWTKEEKEYYTKTKELCNYLKATPYDTAKRQFIFSNFIRFANPKNDTSQNRLQFFDMLLYHFYHFVDSVGLENLDAKPVRFFKNDTTFYKPFNEELKWADSMSLVLAYYDKQELAKPLGALLYEPESRKLLSWVILNIGGWLFLTPNMY